MLLKPGGIDIFYIDESHDRNHYVVTAVQVPFLRPKANRRWRIVWPAELDRAKAWRKQIAADLGIPRRKELHGVKLASGRGNFLEGKYNFKPTQAAEAYRHILQTTFLPDHSVMSVSSSRATYLYGKDRLEAAMYALFQRMRRKCDDDQVNAITFFDQGHPEYRRLYRAAQIYLPTGSARGAWGDGAATKNLPLDMFTKDANEKNSKHCHFTQMADLIAYAAFLKIKEEHKHLTPWQAWYFFGIYDELPKSAINTLVTRSRPRDGIVRL